MKDILKNVFVGFGSLLGIILVAIAAIVFGGAVWLILSMFGLIGIGLFRVLAWLIVGAFAAIGLMYLLGYIVNNSKDA